MDQNNSRWQCLSWYENVSNSPGGRIGCIKQGVLGQVAVPSGSLNLGMAQQKLNLVQGAPCVHQEGGKGMTQVVNTNV